MANLDTKTISQPINRKNHIPFFLAITLLAVLVPGFLYLDHRYALSANIKHTGLAGNVIAILLMAMLYMTPIPSEGILILFFKVYGIYLGILFSWLGMDLGSVITFFIIRIYGQKLLQRVVSPAHFAMVDNWVKRKGSMGLLIARLLPIPTFAINCIAGVIPSIKFWPYLWTAAVSIIPYYLGTALVFLGVCKGSWQSLIFVIIVIVVFWSGSYALNRHRI